VVGGRLEVEAELGVEQSGIGIVLGHYHQAQIGAGLIDLEDAGYLTTSLAESYEVM
jgi:hypothetical protein